jgi:hypothetical protein
MKLWDLGNGFIPDVRQPFRWFIVKTTTNFDGGPSGWDNEPVPMGVIIEKISSLTIGHTLMKIKLVD